MRCYRRYCFMGVRARKISSNTDRRAVDREWEWPPVADVLEISGLGPIKDYIQKRQATIIVHNACQLIFELCTGAENMPGSSQFMRWVEQDVGQEVE